MEKLYLWKLVGTCLCLMSLLGCSVKNQNPTISINGLWAVTFGDSIRMYGEVIYQDNRLCSYSDEFGLAYRNIKIKSDSILEIYDDGVLDNVRTVFLLDSLTMMQATISEGFDDDTPVKFQKIAIDDVSIQKLFEGDSSEQNKYIEEFNFRKLLWEMRK